MNVTKVRVANPLKKRLLGALMAPALVIGLAACDTNDRGGFSADDAAAIRQQIEQVADRLDAVEQRLLDLSSASQPEPAQLISEVRQVRDDVGEARTMLTEVSQQLADEEAEETLDSDFNDPLMPAPSDPLTPPANDPLSPTPGGGLGAPDVRDGLNDLGDDVDQGLDEFRDDVEQGLDGLRDDVQEGIDDLRDGANDVLDGDDVNDTPTPLDDPLVPNAPAF